MSDHLIVGSGPLLDEQGRLREPGYALTPPFEYSHDRIAAPRWRIKDWDYYLVNDDRYAVALTFSDLGYIGLVSAAVIDFDAGSHHDERAGAHAPGTHGPAHELRDGRHQLGEQALHGELCAHACW